MNVQIPTNKPNDFFQWWLSPKLPPVHIWVNEESRPSNPLKFIRLYFRKWLVHPVKRRIVKYYLLYLQTFKGTKVIAITGSAGKTTTKEMLASILSQKGETVYSFANIDPVYNIPTTILKCTQNTKYLILELGVEYPGEMEFYLWLAKPDVGVITNVYQTHTVFFGDIKGVAKEKGTLVKKLDKKATAVLNYDNIHTLKIGGNLNCNVVWFGKNNYAPGLGSTYASSSDPKITSDLKNKFTLHLGKDKVSIALPIVGSQFEANALAAAATAQACGATLEEIKSGLEAFKSADHRMTPIKHKSGALILDDAYNSNPTAAKEALKTLKEVAGKRTVYAVLGDMRELGETEVARHKELGRLASETGVKHLIGVGPLSEYTVESFKGASNWVSKPEEALTLLKPLLKKNCVVLIKGSRGIGLERLVTLLG